MKAAIRSIVPESLIPGSNNEAEQETTTAAQTETGATETGATETGATETTESKMGDKMKALFYDGPFKVSVKDTDMPKIKHPDDVIIKVTTSCICGSRSYSFSCSSMKLWTFSPD